jgi:NAD(P)-dependent dehydrogenase (short-subunit alcohol dehydrogenase family)
MMDLDLHGKTAVVSGSTGGIGYSTALALARLGARVVVTGRMAERVDAAVKKLQAESKATDAVGVHGDLTSAEGATHLVRTIQ